MNAVGPGANRVGRDPPDQSRLGQLAEEQAALRRVATLVAAGAPPEEAFAFEGCGVVEDLREGRRAVPIAEQAGKSCSGCCLGGGR